MRLSLSAFPIASYFRYRIKIEGRWCIESPTLFYEPEDAFAAAISEARSLFVKRY